MLKEVYTNAKVIRTGEYLTTINELTDQVPALRPAVLWRAATEIVRLGEFKGNKLVCEEDKGSAIGAAVSLITGLPLAIARWYSYKLPDEVSVPIQCEYYRGTLYLNGVEPGDKVVIVDDTISTGGTLIALVKAIEQRGASVVEIIALIEKVENQGCSRVTAATGIPVKTGLQISVSESAVTVLE